MAVPIEKKKKTKWYVTLKPLKHFSKFVYRPYCRPKRDFLLPCFRHEVVVSLRGKKNAQFCMLVQESANLTLFQTRKVLVFTQFQTKKGSNPYPLALRIPAPIQPDVFEQLTSTGSGLFFIFGRWFCPNVWTNRLYSSQDT